MDWKKKALRDSRLYLILDRETCGRRPLTSVLKRAILGGIDIVQYRDKTGASNEAAAAVKKLLCISRPARVPLMVNDRLDVCLAADADGLHVGQEDMDAATVRQILGPDKIIGVSCADLKDVRCARRGEADYLGFGPVFATAVKPWLKPVGPTQFQKAQKICDLPVFAIGGICCHNLAQLRRPGHALRVAVCRTIVQAVDITRAARKIKKGLCRV